MDLFRYEISWMLRRARVRLGSGGRMLSKCEIVLMLAKRYGYRSYLEICTPTTGCAFSLVEREQFPRRARLMYRCPRDFSDGEPIDFSTGAESSEELCGELSRSGERFDLVFVDPWHSYESSLRDIKFGLQLIRDDGIVLIHDCNPPNPTCAEPEYRRREWCGVTFAAYLDVVLFTADIHHITVDSDYGCGVISKDRLAHVSDFPVDPALAWAWRAVDLSQKYSFFDENRSRLLHLISTSEFTKRLDRESHTGARQYESGSE